MNDEKKNYGEIIPANKTSVLNISTDYDEHSMLVWDKVRAVYSKSRDLAEQSKLTLREKLKSQHVIILQKIATTEDLALKLILQEYLNDVGSIEQSFLEKMDKMELDNDEYMQKARRDIMTFFDKARDALEDWKSKPERYQTEKELLDNQEAKRLKSVKDRLDKLELKRGDIYDRTVKLFEEAADSIESKTKLKLF